MSKLEKYIEAFSKLHTDRGRSRYTALTKHRAPHKPILLLSVIDLIEEGTINKNFIELTPEVGETFTLYWSTVMPPDKKGKIVYPFFHLRKEGFWHLLPQPGQKAILNNVREVSSIYRLMEMTAGATLDEDLFILLTNKEERNILRTVLIQTYFDQSLTDNLLTQSKINVESYKYSLGLLKKKEKFSESIFGEESYKEKARDQGFRKAVVKAYDHRCAFCGIRIRTPDGHTVVDGAHIIPWSVSKNDKPQNGLSLCKLCHWTFDEGLISISNSYQILVSPRINVNNNIAGHLIMFERRDLFKPFDKYFWPAKESIAYHQSEKFRQK